MLAGRKACRYGGDHPFEQVERTVEQGIVAPVLDHAAGVRHRRAVAAEQPAGVGQRQPAHDVGEISHAQFDAGERLRADFWFAQMTPRVTMSWSAMAPAQRRRRAGMTLASDGDLQENIAGARERVRRALAAVGPELAGVLIDVCCHLKGLEEAERAAGWPQRAGKVVLQLALTRLARHYGIGPAAGASPRAGAVRHWGSDDYRPPFDIPAE
jgi:hypothetical protein